MIPTEIEVTSLVIPFTVALEVRTAAESTLLSVAELAQTFDLTELVVSLYLRSTPVSVDIFWDGDNAEKGEIFVFTLGGGELIKRYISWHSFWADAESYGWIYRESFRKLNAPNLPSLNQTSQF